MDSDTFSKRSAAKCEAFVLATSDIVVVVLYYRPRGLHADAAAARVWVTSASCAST